MSIVQLGWSAEAGNSRELTFEQRVEAQRAIEQVYWNHRIWPKDNPVPKPPLSAVMSDQAIRAKVADYLEKSNALEKWWQHPVTAKQLQAEMDRMAANTRDGATLQELYTALGNDPFVIAETLARQTLADRLIRNAYADDERFHANLVADGSAVELNGGSAPKPSFDAWWDAAQGQVGSTMLAPINALGRERSLALWADWTDRIAAGALPPTPPPEDEPEGESPAPPVTTGLRIVDNGNATFASTGTWNKYSGVGYASDTQSSAAGSGASSTWTFAGLAPGQYRVAATWNGSSLNAVDAPFSVSSGSKLLSTVRVNQQRAASTFTSGGAAWQNLGTFTVSGNSLTVRLNSATSGRVVADAIRLERVYSTSVGSAFRESAALDSL
jgi:hypothetical protein